MLLREFIFRVRIFKSPSKINKQIHSEREKVKDNKQRLIESVTTCQQTYKIKSELMDKSQSKGEQEQTFQFRGESQILSFKLDPLTIYSLALNSTKN